ncbi:hypothetical protein M407DRAFT_241366 [Tulasnella calospora MUT 4182]|uniref:DUF202 domain-containing protein n=1 Tax=Tulasnella calospora MUT 4182 TaxID=1051891 RepID=A0A0C3QJH5_9AGAM|nr:hypothetical protein M407DRAFT_241366 [Tulasnella calospora MUT 4182]
MPKTSEKNDRLQRGCMSIGPSPAEPNVGSACRDFCAFERTFLSHVRLGFILLVLSGSFLLKSRFPNHGSSSTSPEVDMHLREAGLPLGSLYGTSALFVLTLGAYWYEHSFRRMRKGVGFVEGRLRPYEIGIAMIAGLILSTAVLLLVDH